MSRIGKKPIEIPTGVTIEDDVFMKRSGISTLDLVSLIIFIKSIGGIPNLASLFLYSSYPWSTSTELVVSLISDDVR